MENDDIERWYADRGVVDESVYGGRISTLRKWKSGQL